MELEIEPSSVEIHAAAISFLVPWATQPCAQARAPEGSAQTSTAKILRRNFSE
jgi:hypothetical protein